MTATLLLAFQLFQPVDPANFAELHRQRIARAIEQHGPASEQVRIAHRDLGRFWLRQGNPAEAEPWLRLAADTLPLAESLDAQQKRAEARTAFQEAAKSPDPLIAAPALSWLAEDAESAGDLKKSIALHRAAITKQSTAPRRTALAMALQADGQLTEAEQLFRQLIPEHRKRYGNTHPEVATALNNLATLLIAKEKFAEAEILEREAVQTFTATLGPAHLRTGIAASNLADALAAQGKKQEAQRYHRQAQAIFKATLPPGHPWLQK